MHSAAAITYELSVVNLDGSTALSLPPKRNLILDQGLDLVASYSWPNLFQYLHLGTGTDPVKRDSGTITATISGGVITASAAFFEAGDVGRLLKLDSGQEIKITAFSSTTSVTATGAVNDAASQFTIWYVNRTALKTQYNVGNTKVAGAAGNGWNFDTASGTVTWYRTLLSPAFGANQTITEAGWSPGGTTLFGMDLLTTPVAVLQNQQVKVKITLTLAISPKVSTAQVDVGNNGFSTAGTFVPEASLGNSDGLPTIDVNGNSGITYGWPWECYQNNGYLQTIAVDFTQTLWGNGSNPANLTQTSYSYDAYSAGSKKRRGRVLYTTAQSNGTIYGLNWCNNKRFITLKFTTPQTKSSSNTLEVVWDVSWDRVLVN